MDVDSPNQGIKRAVAEQRLPNLGLAHFLLSGAHPLLAYRLNSSADSTC